MSNPYRTPGQTAPNEPTLAVDVPQPGSSKWADDRYMSLFTAALTGASVHAIECSEELVVATAERVADSAWRRIRNTGYARDLF